MAERVIFWAGAMLCALIALGGLAAAAVWALDKVVKAARVYGAVIDFFWHREAFKRYLAEERRAQKEDA
jgi:hypothetical protein